MVHKGRCVVVCVCKLGGSKAGMKVRFVVVIGESASALGDRRVCAERI
jgi:hypothetical protein